MLTDDKAVKQDGLEPSEDGKIKDGAACKNPPKPSAQERKAAKAKDTKSDAPKATTKPDAKPKDDIKEKSETLDADTNKVTDSTLVKVDDEKPEDAEPKPRVYTPEEIEEIARKVEAYKDETPAYKPAHMLSPEFDGTSSYERSIEEFRAQKLDELERLGTDPSTTDQEISQAKDNIRLLEHLYDNYHQGMNVFRTAKGGRSKLRV